MVIVDASPLPLPAQSPIPMVPLALASAGTAGSAWLAVSSNVATLAEGTAVSGDGGWIVWLAPLNSSRYAVIIRRVAASGASAVAWRLGPFRGQPAAIAIASRPSEALIAWATKRGPAGIELFVQRVTTTAESAGITTALLNGEYRETAADGGLSGVSVEQALTMRRRGEGYSVVIPGLLGDCYGSDVHPPDRGLCAPWRWLRWTADDVFASVAIETSLRDAGDRAWMLTDGVHGEPTALAHRRDGTTVLLAQDAAPLATNLAPDARVLSAWNDAGIWYAVLSEKIRTERRLVLWTSQSVPTDAGTLSGALSPIESATLRCASGEPEVLLRLRARREITRSVRAAGGSLLVAAVQSPRRTDMFELRVADAGAANPSTAEANPVVQSEWLGEVLLSRRRDGALQTQRCEANRLTEPVPYIVAVP